MLLPPLLLCTMRFGAEMAELVAAGKVVSGNFNIKTAEVRAAVKIQAHYRGYTVRKAYKLYRLGGQVSELLYSPGSGEAAPKTVGARTGDCKKMVLR